MKKYRLMWYEQTQHEATIEAKDEQDARRIFNHVGVDDETIVTGSEYQDNSLEIEEFEDLNKNVIMS